MGVCKVSKSQSASSKRLHFDILQMWPFLSPHTRSHVQVCWLSICNRQKSFWNSSTWGRESMHGQTQSGSGSRRGRGRWPRPGGPRRWGRSRSRSRWTRQGGRWSRLPLPPKMRWRRRQQGGWHQTRGSLAQCKQAEVLCQEAESVLQEDERRRCQFNNQPANERLPQRQQRNDDSDSDNDSCGNGNGNCDGNGKCRATNRIMLVADADPVGSTRRTPWSLWPRMQLR